MSYRLFPFGSSHVLDHPRGLRRHVGAFVVACAACLIPFAASAADFTVTPTNLVFGGVPAGATATIAVTITNTTAVSQTPNFSGGAPFDPVNFGGSQNCAGVPLAPGGSCQFTYQFHPTTLGAISSSTTIGINADNFPITMSGTGISAFSVAPTNLIFGGVPLGTTATIPVTIINTSGVSQTPNFAGGAPLDPVNFGGSQNCAGVPLAPGGACQFTYQFHPTTLGAISSNTTIGIDSENFSITMAGTGTSSFSVTPTDLVFGGVPLGATATIVVTITNTSAVSQTPNFSGGAPLDSVNFGGFQNCAGVPLASGGSCQFTYQFHPTMLGGIASSTTIGINTENVSITMSGTGTGVSLNQHGLTGSWYEPATSGQGVEVEVFADPTSGTGSTFVSWFTYDTVAGGAERQRWYTAQGPVSTEHATATLAVYQNIGGNFNAPPTTTAQQVGTATLTFDSCTSGQLTYTFTDGNRTGTIPLTRLTQNVTCAASPPYPTNADFALSGNWYGGAATSGQGFTAEVNPISGEFFAAWYTYVPNGSGAGAAGQRWYTAQGPFAPSMRSIPVTINETTGGIFDTPTPPGQQTVAVGTGTMSFQSCSAAKFDYNFTGGSSMGLVGSINLIRVGPVPPGCTS